MTFKVLLSQLSDRTAFEDAVRRHIQALHEFNLTKGKPRPTAHQLVESSIQRVQTPGKPDTYVPDYEIVDDIVTNSVPLEDKKFLLICKLREVENAAINKIVPQRKMRLRAVMYNEAMSTPEDQRTAEQNDYIAQVISDDAKIKGFAKIAAMAEAAIDDLTEDTVDSWQPPTFE